MYKLFCVICISFLLIVNTNGNADDLDLIGSAKKLIPEDAVELAKNTLGKAESAGANVFSNLTNVVSSALENLPFSKKGADLPSIDQGEEMFKKKCLKNGNNETYDLVQVAKEDLKDCMKDILNFETISEEIEKNKHNGSLDMVFKKYCKKMPTLKSCIKNFTEVVEPCLEGNEKIAKGLIINITESLDRFICFKEGDRIALFIAEGGPECLNDKQEAIQQCVNQTYSKHMPADDIDLKNTDSLPDFRLDEPQCRDVNKVQLCIVTELEKCSEPTPANIIDSLFNYIRQATPCSPYKPDSLLSSGVSLPLSVSLLAIGLSTLLMFNLNF